MVLVLCDGCLVNCSDMMEIIIKASKNPKEEDCEARCEQGKEGDMKCQLFQMEFLEQIHLEQLYF